MRFSRLQKCFTYSALGSFICLLIFGIRLLTNPDTGNFQQQGADVQERDTGINPVSSSQADPKEQEIFKEEEPQPFPAPNYNVHLFYYPWYGNPKMDGKYLHWNHQYIRHWRANEADRWPSGRHQPPDDIGANFYPKLGSYSSKDPDVLDDHMKQIRSTGAGVLAVSWYPPGMADSEGEDVDSVFPLILNHADRYGLKVCVHIEPYKDRNEENMRTNLKYIVDQYGNHSAFYRHRLESGKLLPLYYVYDSYLLSDDRWRSILTPGSPNSLRGTELDGVFIGLLVEKSHAQSLKTSGFDGFYTYFSSNKFTFGSNPSNWNWLNEFAKSSDLLFIPSVGPGYIDERVRPWNRENTKERQGGKYYDTYFAAAIKFNADVITVTSFNEWGEGTQIEEAVPKTVGDFKYHDYLPHESDYYLVLTRKWIFKYSQYLKRIPNNKRI